jgi:hypothetical protein
MSRSAQGNTADLVTIEPADIDKIAKQATEVQQAKQQSAMQRPSPDYDIVATQGDDRSSESDSDIADVTPDGKICNVATDSKTNGGVPDIATDSESNKSDDSSGRSNDGGGRREGNS